MKVNGNDKKSSDYYIGLDVGTNSVGWAVTDTYYNVLRFRGNSMWGVRLFDEANTAAERRAHRTNRRLNQRRKQRLHLLEHLFNNEICKIDPAFFIRLHSSHLHLDDKASNLDQYSLFADKEYTDYDFHHQYPTMYHLRSELVNSKEPHDPRLVFLALHHIMKNRGHFLFEMENQEEYKKTKDILAELNQYLLDYYGKEIDFIDQNQFENVISDKTFSITAKKKMIKECVRLSEVSEEDNIDINVVVESLSGAKIKLADLFNDDVLEKAELKSFSLKDNISEQFDVFSEILDDRVDLIVLLKSTYDSALLAQILGSYDYICQAKVAQYEQNKQDLYLLKSYVREFAPKKYKVIFYDKKDKLNNYSAYSRKNSESGEYHCNQEDFCKYLKKELSDMKNHAEYKELYKKIEEVAMLPKLRGSENSVIPNQVHRRELVKILENAAEYLDFLNEKDDKGFCVKEKIISLFDFKIPYYVGPLNKKSDNSWVERSDDAIYPWNFNEIVDLEKTAEQYISRLTNRCTYTGDDVIPKDSLLYSKYMVLNELNPLKVNGNPATVEQKQTVYQNLFIQDHAKVTKKRIKQCLSAAGLISESDEISGVDDVIKSKLKSYHDFKKILERTHDEQMVEEIIQRILVFGEDKKMLKQWLKKHCSVLKEEEVRSILRLKYSDWGRLSKTFLTGIYAADENGEAQTIVDCLYDTNHNLNQLMSSDFDFAKNAEWYRKDKYGSKDSVADMMEELYLAPPVKRSLVQTLKIVDEIVDVKKSAPKKIFIEVTREAGNEKKGHRTVSRKDRLMELYSNCKQEQKELFEKLNATDENMLRKDSLYLYYTQFGKCMYSGEPIDLDELETQYDVDHIFPQSRVKDDSLDNRVLVKRKLNEEKGNNYPLKAEIREKMGPFWTVLKAKGFISEKKFERLLRNAALTDEELSAFVQRQLVETSQSTKALATILSKLYAEAGTKIVYSKAGNVSAFRQAQRLTYSGEQKPDYLCGKNERTTMASLFVKCREVNDLHHAKDAYLNIVVGNVYDTKFTEQFFRNIHSENYSLNKVFAYPVKGAWDPKESIKTVYNTMAKNNILVTRKAFIKHGKISEQTIEPAGEKDRLEIKRGLDPKKYGGYNNISGAYFCVVEHLSKKKRIRTIEPVYIYQQKLYETDPVRYCTEVLGLTEPKIIQPCIMTQALVELENKRLYLMSRDGDRRRYNHSYQLILDPKVVAYINNISKYLSRCDKAKKELPIYSYDGISKEQNEWLYEIFLVKLKNPIYYKLFEGIYQHCAEHFDDFKALSISSQCVLLIKLLKTFKCDSQLTDLCLIRGTGTMARIRYSKNITNLKSAYLIHQSITGLYETREDLLR